MEYYRIVMKLHISLRVKDLDRSIEFYTAFFGIGPHKVRHGYANFDLAEPPLKFALNQGPLQTTGGGLEHMGFQVANEGELSVAKEWLKTAGLATFDEDDTTCCYARQDKVWVHDPDGNEWEIYLLTDDLKNDHEHDHIGQPLAANAETDSSTLLIQRDHRCCE